MLNLITDRTQNDVNEAKNIINKIKDSGFNTLTVEQKEIYLKGLKGCYNITDINRVENAMLYVSNLLNSLSYPNTITYKQFKISDIINEYEVNIFLNNLNIIKQAFVVLQTTPETPQNYKPFNYANDIEKILVDINFIIGCLTNNFIYSGVASSGQNRLWQRRFRTNKIWLSQRYTFDKYAENDTISMIAANDSKQIKSKTKILGLSQLDDYDDIYASIYSINTDMNSLDELIGGVSR